MTSSPSNPNLGFQSVSRGGGSGDLRRSRRLSIKSGITTTPTDEGEKTQGETTPISIISEVINENVDQTSNSGRKTRVSSTSRSRKGSGGSVKSPLESSSNTIRRSSRLATKFNNIGDNSSSPPPNVDFVVDKKRMSGGSSGSSNSKKPRLVLESFNQEEGSGNAVVAVDLNRLFNESLEDSDKETIGLVDSSGDRSNADVFVVPDSPTNSIQVSLSPTGSPGIWRRTKSVRLLGSDEVGFGSTSEGRIGEGNVEESNIDLNAFNYMGTETREVDDLGIIEVQPMMTATERNIVTGYSRRRSGRLAASAKQQSELGSGRFPSEARSGEGKVEATNLDSKETKNAGDLLFVYDIESVPETGERGGAETCEVESVDVAKDCNLDIGKGRYSQKEKGKGKLDFNLNLRPEEQPELELGLGPAVSDSVPIQLPKTLDSERVKEAVRLRVRSHTMRRQRFHNIARESAAEFAHFQAEEDEAPTSDSGEVSEKAEDWPGPFATAMKIIKDRKNKENNPEMNSTFDPSNTAPKIHWVPQKDPGQNRAKAISPSLKDLCLNLLSKNPEVIPSLKFVPDELRSELTQMLCDSRKMDIRFMGLLVAEPPEVVCVKDCSWMTEDQMTETFGECDISNLSVLQLDLCGRCMPDYVLRNALARSPNSLRALVDLSFKGACRVTDDGLNSLVASAPFLRSINLGQCSLITSTSIDTIADRLGLLLKELYLDDCQNIDAMLMLPALKKLKCLEVLSLADMQTVCDDFVCRFITECSPNMKELGLANCGKLTDASVKAIAEKCYGLRALDFTNLRRLTDLSIGYIARECKKDSTKCPSIQKLKLCRNALNDEAIAALLQISGESLTELSLNSIKNVGNHTALSLATNCKQNLLSLDLSWCRNLTDEALGLIVDSCVNLRVLKLFGCTQISNFFVDGHSNPCVRIIGLKMTPILEHLKCI